MNDKKMILIVSDGEKTTAMINGKVVAGATELVFRARGYDVSMDIMGVTAESFDRFSEEDFWNQVSRLMGNDVPCKGRSFFESVEGYKDKMERPESGTQS